MRVYIVAWLSLFFYVSQVLGTGSSLRSSSEGSDERKLFKLCDENNCHPTSSPTIAIVQCQPGQFWNSESGQCTQCPADLGGLGGAGNQEQQCGANCPTNSNPVTSAQTEQRCRCNPGFSRNATRINAEAFCQRSGQCPAGTWFCDRTPQSLCCNCPRSGSMQMMGLGGASPILSQVCLRTCPANSSPASGGLPSACACNAGFTRTTITGRRAVCCPSDSVAQCRAQALRSPLPRRPHPKPTPRPSRKPTPRPSRSRRPTQAPNTPAPTDVNFVAQGYNYVEVQTFASASCAGDNTGEIRGNTLNTCIGTSPNFRMERCDPATGDIINENYADSTCPAGTAFESFRATAGCASRPLIGNLVSSTMSTCMATNNVANPFQQQYGGGLLLATSRTQEICDGPITQSEFWSLRPLNTCIIPLDGTSPFMITECSNEEHTFTMRSFATGGTDCSGRIERTATLPFSSTCTQGDNGLWSNQNCV